MKSLLIIVLILGFTGCSKRDTDINNPQQVNNDTTIYPPSADNGGGGKEKLYTL